MALAAKPDRRPGNPHFSSGPCAKRPGWSLAALEQAHLSRFHRRPAPLARIRQLLERSKALLGLPQDYLLAIMPGSDTGAFEAAMWSMLGSRGIEILAWDKFGKTWVTDVVRKLQLDEVVTKDVDYGSLPDLETVDFERDVIFTWNGTTAGVRVPGGEWIPERRGGLTFVDATSAVFTEEFDWAKIDVLTYSWQKTLGGEAQHGMLVLSPRAVERLRTYAPPRAIPKIFRIVEDDAFDEKLFDGETLNTPSMLCVEDHLDALKWAEAIGGRAALIARTQANAAALAAWVERTPWISHVAPDPKTRSLTGICLEIVDTAVTRLDRAGRIGFAEALATCLEREGAAYDIVAHREAPPGLRIWCGPTVETADIEILTEWLDWGFAQVSAEQMQAA
jgi:phosphoserine aminotransferase